jgi:hypothetical protein
MAYQKVELYHHNMKKIFKLLSFIVLPACIMPAMLLTSCKRQPYDDNIEILGNRVIECM